MRRVFRGLREGRAGCACGWMHLQELVAVRPNQHLQQKPFNEREKGVHEVGIGKIAIFLFFQIFSFDGWFHIYSLDLEQIFILLYIRLLDDILRMYYRFRV